MTISTETMELIAEMALDRAKAYRKTLRDQMKGLGPNQRRMTALEHKDWFEMHAVGWWEQGPPQIDPATGQPQVDQMGQPIPSQRFKDGPNWVRVLAGTRKDGGEMAEGGHTEYRRYMKTLERIASGELRETDGLE